MHYVVLTEQEMHFHPPNPLPCTLYRNISVTYQTYSISILKRPTWSYWIRTRFLEVDDSYSQLFHDSTTESATEGQKLVQKQLISLFVHGYTSAFSSDTGPSHSTQRWLGHLTRDPRVSRTALILVKVFLAGPESPFSIRFSSHTYWKNP